MEQYKACLRTRRGLVGVDKTSNVAMKEWSSELQETRKRKAIIRIYD